MRFKVLIPYLLFALALPAAALFVAFKVTPPPYSWKRDPLELLLLRSPIVAFASASTASVLRDTVSAGYRDGSRIEISVKDPGDFAAVAAEMRRRRDALAAGGARIEGQDSDFRYFVTGDEEKFGRVLVAEHAVVDVVAPTETGMQYRLFSIPYLEDHHGESLGKDLLENHRTRTWLALACYLVLVLVPGWRLARRRPT